MCRPTPRIDRATVGETRIGDGTKVDNLVQIGHASHVGENTLICAQTGLAGSSVIGNNVILAGQTGVAGHCTVGDGVILTAQSAVSHDIPPGKDDLRLAGLRQPRLAARGDHLPAPAGAGQAAGPGGKEAGRAGSEPKMRRPRMGARSECSRASAIWVGSLTAVLIALAACHSYHIDTTVENRTGGAIQLLEVDYPSASFGADSLAAGARLALSHSVARQRPAQGAIHGQRRPAECRSKARRSPSGKRAGWRLCCCPAASASFIPISALNLDKSFLMFIVMIRATAKSSPLLFLIQFLPINRMERKKMRASAASITSRDRFPWLRRPAISLLLAICLLFAGLAAFLQTTLPLVTLLYPLLALLMFRKGARWAAMAAFTVALIASWCIWHGLTPFAQARPHPWINLSIFIGSAVILLYFISLVREREQEAVRQLEKIAALHALVSENSRDAIILADLDGHRSYVSSAAESLGWRPENLLTQGGAEMVHPDDQQRAQAIVNELNSGREGAMIECRVQKPTGEYIWVEASLRLVRDAETGAPIGNSQRGARCFRAQSRRRRNCKRPTTPSRRWRLPMRLTGLANRRRFDQYLATEWRRSMRDRQPLSLLMLDADKFKAYNDTYGHQRGDNCLKQIAEACMDVVSRPGDLVARFGGEEFVVVLPNTESNGAMHCGQRNLRGVCAAAVCLIAAIAGHRHHLRRMRHIGSQIRQTRPGLDRDGRQGAL